MDLYVFKDKLDQVRCLQCALWYDPKTPHKCPAAFKNVLPGHLDLDDLFGPRKKPPR